ncbi:hypothetical protein K5549_019221, partial [Capra hircus]
CRTDCLEAPLSRAFQRLGRKVGAHPWVFLLLPVALTAVLGTGLMYLPRDGDEDLEEQYTPIGSPAKAERRFVKSTDVPYASLLVVSDTETLLEPDILEEISKVDDAVQALTVTQDNGTQIPYSEVCAKNQGACVPPNPLLFAWKRNKGLNLTAITFPIYSPAGQIVSLANILGGTVLGPSQALLQAKAMRLQYYLETGEGEENERSKAWTIHFLTKFGSFEKSLALKKIQVVYFSSLSRKLEFEATSRTVVPLFHLAYLLIILFAIVSCY